MPTENSFEVFFTKKAAKRLTEAALFIYEKSGSEEKADRFIGELKKCIVQMLGTFPKLGRSAPEFGKDIRKMVCRSFTVLYRIEDEKVVILTIFRENLP